MRRISEILSLTYNAFVDNNLAAARDVEPLEQVIDGLKANMRNGNPYFDTKYAAFADKYSLTV